MAVLMLSMVKKINTKILPTNSKLKIIYRRVNKQVLKSPVGIQEMEHINQVIYFSSLLSQKLNLNSEDSFICLAAAILHDVGRFYSFSHHTDIDILTLQSYLKFRQKINNSIINQIHTCVQRHSTSSLVKPQNLLEKIVFDADNLTVFTWFGIKRWFFKAESWGKSSNLIEAESELIRLKKLILNDEFLFLPQSRKIAKSLFYFRSKPDEFIVTNTFYI